MAEPIPHRHHHHDHARPARLSIGRAFALGVALNLGFVAIEAGFGVWTGSLALLADAGHNFSDVIGLLLAWGAATLAARSPTHRFTYGLGGSTILAALANAMILMVVVGGIVWEALHRFTQPAPINGMVVMAVAAAGIVVNTATALLFMRDRETDLNVRGAFVHMAADALVSLGVVVAGVVMLFTGWLWIDPAVSLVIAAVIFLGTWGLLKESLRLALQAVPEGVDVQVVRDFLAAQPGVADMHDLHIWAMSTTDNALTAHLIMPQGHPGDDTLARLAEEIEQRFRISHVTLQVETGCAPCKLAPDHVV